MDVKRYLIQKTPIGTIMKENPEGNWVETQDFERVTAERDALQLRLNAVEEENDRLRSEMRGYVIQHHASIGNTEHHEDCQRDLAELENRS